MFLLIVLVGIASLLVYQKWSLMIDHYLSGLTTLKGPRSFPFVGGLFSFFPVSESLWKLISLLDVYGKTYKVTAPYTVGIVTIDPDLIEVVMTDTKCINKGYLYKFLNDWLKEGLLISKKAKWRQRRKLLTPAFHFKILEEFVKVFHKNEMTLIDLLTQASKTNKSLNIYKYITLYALDNINETAMGTSVNAQLDEDSEFVNATKFMTLLLCNRAASPYKYADATFALTPEYWQQRKALNILHSYTMSVINSRRQQLLTNANTIIKQETDETIGIKKKPAFLDLLLNATIDGEPLSNDDIREEVDTFMFEGHDTISAGISFALYKIAENKDIQQRIFDEQYKIFGNDSNRMSTLEDVKEMHYLEMVIKEAMRLYPSVPVITRTPTAEFVYKDLVLRRGLEILIPIFAVHRDETLYPDPLRFDPERFNTENQSKRHPFAYLPFSAGHRNCIGQKFAMAEMKSVIGRVIREFKLSPCDKVPIELPSAIVLFSRTGVHVQLEKRTS